MITTLKNNLGYVVCYMEHRQVDKDGTPRDNGEYFLVEDAWVHKDLRHKGYMLKVIEKAWDSSVVYNKYLKYVYYDRRKYKGRKSRIYTISQWLRFAKKI